MDTSSFIVEITGQDFETKVVEASRKVPVLVDFWAAWCGPCQMLTPLLARLANEYQGKFILAKVNTDAEQELAMRYGIRSLPTVQMFRDGRVVDAFLGVQPERTIRALIDRHITRESDQTVAQALDAEKSGQVDDALAKLRAAVASDPGNERARLELARILITRMQVEEAARLIEWLPALRRMEPDITALLANLELARVAAAAPPAAELESALAADPGNVAARYQLGARQVVAGEYEAGMEQLLEVVRRDRKFGEDAGRKALVKVFNLLGAGNPLVARYRGLLASAIN